MPQNENNMGKWGATSYIIGNIVGSGVFITPSTVLKNSSSVGVALIIWVVSAIVAILGAFSYIELGTSIRKSGADYAYLCYVKWESLAFSFMFCNCILIYPMVSIIQAEAFSQYALEGLGIKICEPWEKFANKTIGFTIIWFILYVNFFSIRNVVARFQIVASTAKILTTGLIISIGLYNLCFKKGSLDNLKNAFNPINGTKLEIDKLIAATFAGFYSYDGWDVLNIGTEDLKNPQIALPFAIIVGMSTVTFIFLAMNISILVTLTIPQIIDKDMFANTFAQHTLGSLAPIMPFLICIVLIGSLNVTIFSASRYLYSAARNGNFPAFISCMNEKQNSPRAALFVHVLLAFGISFVGNINELINNVSFATFLQRVLTIIALLYIRIKHIPVHSKAIRTPLIIPICYLLTTAFLIGLTIYWDTNSAKITLFILLFAFIIYVLFLWEKTLQRYEIFQKIVHFFNDITSIGAQITFNGLIELDNELDDVDDDAEKEKKPFDIEKIENKPNQALKNNGLKFRKPIYIQ